MPNYYHTETGGYFISMTNKRYQQIKKKYPPDKIGYESRKHTGSSVKLVNRKI